MYISQVDEELSLLNKTGEEERRRKQQYVSRREHFFRLCHHVISNFCVYSGSLLIVIFIIFVSISSASNIYDRHGVGSSTNSFGDNVSNRSKADDDGGGYLCISASNSQPVLGGYDVVAYFSLEEGSAAVLGSSSYTTEYNGYTFRFANEHNKMLFSKAPIDYVPQFGGFCAYGISSEDFWTWDTVQISGPESDPNVWEIIDGKLYTFMYEVPKLVFLDGDVASLIKQGSAKWESFTSQQPYNYFNTQCLWFDSECGHGGTNCLEDYMVNHTKS